MYFSSVKDSLLLKVERAEEHISDAQVVWRAFLAENPYPVFHKNDMQTGERSYYLLSTRAIPDTLPLIIGDAVHNLRSALDHLAYHLVCVQGNGSPSSASKVYFPVAANAEEYKRTSLGKVQGIGNKAMKLINAIEPYGGGNGETFWHLHRLDIIDKHRLLLTVGAQNSSHSMSPSKRAEIKSLIAISIEVEHALLTDSEVVHFPLKAGDKLHAVPYTEAEDNMNFPFEIAFGEPEVIKGKAVFVHLHRMAHLIRTIIWKFYRAELL